MLKQACKHVDVYEAVVLKELTAQAKGVPQQPQKGYAINCFALLYHTQDISRIPPICTNRSPSCNHPTYLDNVVVHHVFGIPTHGPPNMYGWCSVLLLNTRSHTSHARVESFDCRHMVFRPVGSSFLLLHLHV